MRAVHRLLDACRRSPILSTASQPDSFAGQADFVKAASTFVLLQRSILVQYMAKMAFLWMLSAFY